MTIDSAALPGVPEHLGQRVAEAVAAIRARSPRVPSVGLTLGSGLGGVLDSIEDATLFETRDLPHWPASTVSGHRGRLVLGLWEGVPVVALAGRSHRYEGYSLDRVTFAVRVMMALGARTMIFTNAVGAMNPRFEPADVMVATDHINGIGRRGLFEPHELAERRMGRRVASYYDPELREALVSAGLETGTRVHRGVLMGGHGPTYETSAEVRMAAEIGADVACMSTVHEVTVAAELGAATASLSCITNQATGLSPTPLTHREVTEVADRVAGRLRTLLGQFLRSRRTRLAT
ncbi:MAG: purine-nucleoside phosphorylase [Candidatus Eisenbacteria bacterium]|uniref:Purine nucleoside phosphorylase n=1 Tax=Eiseniibacteriota bacterium TaxID=2212470 RepID=A0A849SN69_UNCEI|nr:purine-nucleoside phosphorylase [Candidatus Eisenbacteria bacterium]